MLLSFQNGIALSSRRTAQTFHARTLLSASCVRPVSRSGLYNNDWMLQPVKCEREKKPPIICEL